MAINQVNQFLSKSPDETLKYAEELLQIFPKTRIFLLLGPLGSGKTSFVKGLAKALKIDPQRIKSPSFVGRNDYGALIHYDFYLSPPSFEQLQEDLQGEALLCLEWPEEIEAFLIDSLLPSMKVGFEYLDPSTRQISYKTINSF